MDQGDGPVVDLRLELGDDLGRERGAERALVVGPVLDHDIRVGAPEPRRVRGDGLRRGGRGRRPGRGRRRACGRPAGRGRRRLRRGRRPGGGAGTDRERRGRRGRAGPSADEERATDDERDDEGRRAPEREPVLGADAGGDGAAGASVGTGSGGIGSGVKGSSLTAAMVSHVAANVRQDPGSGGSAHGTFGGAAGAGWCADAHAAAALGPPGHCRRHESGGMLGEASDQGFRRHELQGTPCGSSPTGRRRRRPSPCACDRTRAHVPSATEGLVRLSLAGRPPDTDASLLAVPRRTALLGAFTAGLIAAGVGLLALGTLLLLVVPGAGLRPAIAIPGVPAPWGGIAGLAAWTGFALLGGMRIVTDPGGHGSLSLHLPFIAAAMTLGGPVAGAWVAALGTFDRRELREAPWYGVLANHAAARHRGGRGRAGAGGGAGRRPRHRRPGGPGVAARGEPRRHRGDGRRVRAAGGGHHRPPRRPRARRGRSGSWTRRSARTAVAEAMLGWVFVVVWLAVGWWAPILCTVLVLTLWRAAEDADRLDHDDLTGVLSRRAFAVRAAQAADRARRGVDGAAYLFLDLDDFKQLNDGPRNHQVGDQVLAELGARLRRCVRVTDAVGRRGGDEFMLLFNGVRDEATRRAARPARPRDGRRIGADRRLDRDLAGGPRPARLRAGPAAAADARCTTRRRRWRSRRPPRDPLAADRVQQHQHVRPRADQPARCHDAKRGRPWRPSATLCRDSPPAPDRQPRTVPRPAHGCMAAGSRGRPIAASGEAHCMDSGYHPHGPPPLCPYLDGDAMKVGVARETAAGERRVALVPEALGKLTAAGLEVLVEAGAGAGALIPDQAFIDAGATIVSTADLYAASDVILRVQKPSADEAAQASQRPDRHRPAGAAPRPGPDGHAGRGRRDRGQPRRDPADAVAGPDDGRPVQPGEHRRLQGRPDRGQRVRALLPAARPRPRAPPSPPTC